MVINRFTIILPLIFIVGQFHSGKAQTIVNNPLAFVGVPPKHNPSDQIRKGVWEGHQRANRVVVGDPHAFHVVQLKEILPHAEHQQWRVLIQELFNHCNGHFWASCGLTLR